MAARPIHGEETQVGKARGKGESGVSSWWEPVELLGWDLGDDDRHETSRLSLPPAVQGSQAPSLTRSAGVETDLKSPGGQTQAVPRATARHGRGHGTSQEGRAAPGATEERH